MTTFQGGSSQRRSPTGRAPHDNAPGAKEIARGAVGADDGASGLRPACLDGMSGAVMLQQVLRLAAVPTTRGAVLGCGLRLRVSAGFRPVFPCDSACEVVGGANHAG